MGARRARQASTPRARAVLIRARIGSSARARLQALIRARASSGAAPLRVCPPTRPPPLLARGLRARGDIRFSRYAHFDFCGVVRLAVAGEWKPSIIHRDIYRMHEYDNRDRARRLRQVSSFESSQAPWLGTGSQVLRASSRESVSSRFGETEGRAEHGRRW